MAKNNNLQDLLRSVADAIRSRKGTTDLINAQDFDQEIRTIQGVGDDTKEVVKAISGIESDEDVTLANAIAKAYDDTPTEQVWSGTRTTAKGATIKDGVASVHSIKGRSLKVAQITPIRNVAEIISNDLTARCENGVISISGTPSKTGWIGLGNFTIWGNQVSGHKYLVNIFYLSHSLVGNVSLSDGYVQNNIRVPNKSVIKTSSVTNYLYIYIESTDVVINELKFKANNFDLTAMFGAGNEPTSANEFANRLGYATIEDVPYIPYGTSIVSSMPREIVSRGRNLWDEEWEVGQISSITGLPYAASNAIRSKNFIPIAPGKTYYHKTSATATSNFFEYDANKVFIKTTTLPINRWFSVSENCRFIKFVESTTYGTIYKNDICINVSDSLNGTYSPYMPPSTLPITLPSVFADGIKGVGTAFDELTPTKATQRFGVADLGNFLWTARSDYGQGIFSTTSLKDYMYVSDVRGLCADYTSYRSVDGIASFVGAEDKSIALYFNPNTTNKNIYIKDTRYTDAVAFSQAMQGVKFIYPLATPIETTLDETKAFYQVQNGGTEEIVKDNVAPFVADIAYREPSASELVNGLSNAINE